MAVMKLFGPCLAQLDFPHKDKNSGMYFTGSFHFIWLFQNNLMDRGQILMDNNPKANIFTYLCIIPLGKKSRNLYFYFLTPSTYRRARRQAC